MEKNKDKIEEDIKETNESEIIDDINIDNTDAINPDNNDTNEEPAEEETQETEEDILKEEIKTLKEEKIRVLAEMENLRKRFDREKIDSIKYGSVNFARDILSPGDNLERALSAINQEEEHPQSIKNLIEGLLMVKKELSTALEKNGITKIESLDKKFDPNLHQAMMEIENNDLEEGIVVQEIQTGYMMHDRLLRPAMVGVSKKPQKPTEVESDKEVKSESEDSEKDPKN
ncbi:MAG: nucleotide exchange factor GrpE [Proteobacteria bacterium]|nr:nucleotide exchange factor GrpE [Pseudomonadota bacterium]MDA1180876.1 nucleotide exchange factor GrpE [Pseudomonadota bacterium]